MTRRTRQVGEMLRDEVDDIIRKEMHDPRLGFWSITRVEVPTDLRSARVYISVLGTDDERAETLAALRHGAGFIRQHLKPRLRMRQIPMLEFRDDRSLEYAATISKALHDLESKEGIDPNQTEPMFDPVQADALLERLISAECVVIPTHQNVDADGLATPLALMHALKPLNANIVPVISDGKLPKSLRFLPGIRSVLQYGKDPLPDFDLICLLDCSDRRRLGAFYEDDPTRIEGAFPLLNVDHHVTNEHYGEINIVVPDAAATAEIVAELFRYWNIPITKTIAQCLLAGIYGDTLGLRTDATRPRTMRTSADLVEAGANPSRITDELFRFKPISSVCLWEKALARVEQTGKLIWTEVNFQILGECGADASEGEGIVNFLSGTEGTAAAAMLYQNETGYRVSMRSLSGDIDVAAICAVFGGGGHPRAAGATIIGGTAERDDFLNRVAEMLV